MVLFSLLSEVGQVKRTCEALLCGPTPTLAQQYFTPEIIRIAPPLHVAEDEVMYLYKVIFFLKLQDNHIV